jgi:O-antigen/teichoic acid export membrane protein
MIALWSKLRSYFVGMRAAAALSMTFTCLSFAASFFTSIFIARALGPGERGIYGLIFVWATSLAVLSTLSFGELVGIHALRNANDDTHRLQYLRLGGRYQAAISLLTLPFMIGIFIVGMMSLGITASPIALGVTAASCLAASLNNILGNSHRVMGEHLRFNLNRAAFPAFHLLSVVIVLAMVGWNPSLRIILIAFFAATIAGIVCNAYLGFDFIKSAYSRAGKNDVPKAWSVRQFAREMTPLHVSIVLLFVAISIDRFLAGAILDYETFGYYAAAVSIVQPVSLLFTITTKTLMIGDRQLFNSQHKNRRLFQYVWMSLGAGVLMSLIAWPILDKLTPFLLGVAYDRSREMIPWLLLGFCLMPLRTTLAEFGRVSGYRVAALAPDVSYILTIAAAVVFFKISDPGRFFGLSMLAGNVVAISTSCVLIYLKAAKISTNPPETRV